MLRWLELLNCLTSTNFILPKIVSAVSTSRRQLKAVKHYELSVTAAPVAKKRGRDNGNPWLNLPEVAAFTKGFSLAVRMVDSGLFEMNCEETKLALPAFWQKRVRDVVGVGRIYSGGKKHDKLSYCCLALMKSYFTKSKGLHSYSFYDSMDGKRIIGLGKWESEDAASASKPNGCSAKAFWKSLEAKKLKYDVYRVLYASKKY